jgi:transposase
VLTGILFVLQSGIPWEMLPQEMGCNSGMSRWRRLRDWPECACPIASTGRASSSILPPFVLWDQVKTGPSPTGRARPGSKYHPVAEAQGIPLALLLTGANRNDNTQLLPLIDAFPLIRCERGRPLSKPANVQGDRGYDHDKYCWPRHAAGIRTQIPVGESRTAVASAKPDGSSNAQSPGRITSGACAFDSCASPSSTKRS